MLNLVSAEISRTYSGFGGILRKLSSDIKHCSFTACDSRSSTSSSANGEEGMPESTSTTSWQDDFDQLMIEFEAGRLTSKHFPTKLSKDDIHSMKQFHSYRGMARHMRFLATKEREKGKNKVQKQAKKTRVLSNLQPQKESVFRSCPFLITDHCCRLVRRQRRALAHNFGLRVVFDASWTDTMLPDDMGLTAGQLNYCGNVNSHHRCPGELTIANLRPDHDFYQRHLQKRLFASEASPEVFSNDSHESFRLSSAHYLDLFPREQLVYLSPDSPNILDTPQPNDVYVIGALVDKFNRCPGSTYDRANSEGIRTARLPLDENV